MSDCHACTGCTLITGSPGRSADTAVFAIVGPPNSGKSTLFNRLTGMRQKVANFPGVTVEHRTGRARVGGRRSIDLIDWDFPCFHRLCDNLHAVSEASLDASGEAVWRLLPTL